MGVLFLCRVVSDGDVYGDVSAGNEGERVGLVFAFWFTPERSFVFIPSGAREPYRAEDLS
jgi:hypothetical protein